MPQYAKELAHVYRQLGHFEKQYQIFPEAQEHLNQAMILCRKLVEDYPALPDYRLELANVATELAHFLAKNDPALAEKTYREGVEAIARLADKQPPDPSHLYALGRVYCQMAENFMDHKKWHDARPAFEESVRYFRKALDLRPQNPGYRQDLLDTINDLSFILLKLGETTKAAEAAEELPRLRPNDSKSYYAAAIFLTKCLMVSKDEGKEYGHRAVRVLQQAAENRLIKDPSILEKAVFAPLLDRHDFLWLCQSLAPAGSPPTWP